MTLHPLAEQLLTPNRQAVIFASKGVISMALALFASMYLQLDRPYWALVSAVFLQLRPESGLVIEKGLCQILGSIVGGGFGLLILSLFMPYPMLALGCLTVWVGVNSAASSMVHNTNYIYGFAMAGMTAALVVILVMADASTASSPAAFEIAQARISEITVGAICAMLVSQLLWPLSVKDSLREHARTVINESLQYLILELGSVSTHKQRHVHSDQVFEAMVALSDDSSAVSYEGPEGPGRARAAHLLCQRVLSLLAVAQSLGRFHRNQADQVSPAFKSLLKLMRQYFEQIAAATSYEAAYPLAQSLRRDILEHRANYEGESPVVIRLTQTALELVADLVMILKAYNALEEHDRTLLKSTQLQNYRDPLIGAVNGFRTSVVFLLGAFVWVQTA
ncbi:FUSC family protein, partial [Pseudomaricurvus sp.]|uniref:FUSC family protein n=1 Tax=Pseudomaricurvus sp. TaxID=2004510 RepID=UPI003F6CF527